MKGHSITLDEAGTYPYHCMMHPWRLGTIIVEEPPVEEPTVEEPTENKIPDWVRNIFIWYANEQISEIELIGAIEYLVQQGIIELEK